MDSLLPRLFLSILLIVVGFMYLMSLSHYIPCSFHLSLHPLLPLFLLSDALSPEDVNDRVLFVGKL